MKKGIMGAHGTGKTGFALRMAANLKKDMPGERVGILSEVVRGCPFPVNKNASPEAQLWIYHKQMTTEIEMAAQNETLVCDRTVLDALVYAEYSGFAGIVEDLLGAAIAWLCSYDDLYWLRPASRLSADGFRSTDPAFQKKTDEIFEAWIKSFGIPVCSIRLGEHGNG